MTDKDTLMEYLEQIERSLEHIKGEIQGIEESSETQSDRGKSLTPTKDDVGRLVMCRD